MTDVMPDQSFSIVSDLSRALHLSVKQVAEVLSIHPRTLQRRRESGRLEEAELLKAQMLNEVFSLAVDAFQDEAKAREWLFAELSGLEFKRPVDMLGTIKGYEHVKTMLGQIIFGVH